MAFGRFFGWVGQRIEAQHFDLLVKEGYTSEFSTIAPLLKTRVATSLVDIHSYGDTSFVQEGNDCTAANLKRQIEHVQLAEIHEDFEEQKFRRVFAPYIYATARNEVLGGVSYEGSSGSAVALAVNRYGVLFESDTTPPYSGQLVRNWGYRGSQEHRKYIDQATPHTLNVVRLTDGASASEVVDRIALCLKARLFCCIASWRGFRVTSNSGQRYYVPSGSWAHQMGFSHINASGDFWRDNTWPSDQGAYNRPDDVRAEISRGGVEVFAYFNFKGEPGPIDPGIIVN